MSRKPIGPIIEGVKKYGPKAGKFIKDNHKEITAALGVLGVGDSIKKRIEKKEESNKTEGKNMHHRKGRYNHYKINYYLNWIAKIGMNFFNIYLK